MKDWNSVTWREKQTQTNTELDQREERKPAMKCRMCVYLKKARHVLFLLLFKYLLLNIRQYLQNARNHFVHSDPFPPQ